MKKPKKEFVPKSVHELKLHLDVDMDNHRDGYSGNFTVPTHLHKF